MKLNESLTVWLAAWKRHRSLMALSPRLCMTGWCCTTMMLLYTPPPSSTVPHWGSRNCPGEGMRLVIQQGKAEETVMCLLVLCVSWSVIMHCLLYEIMFITIYLCTVSTIWLYLSVMRIVLTLITREVSVLALSCDLQVLGKSWEKRRPLNGSGVCSLTVMASTVHDKLTGIK